MKSRTQRPRPRRHQGQRRREDGVRDRRRRPRDQVSSDRKPCNRRPSTSREASHQLVVESSHSPTKRGNKTQPQDQGADLRQELDSRRRSREPDLRQELEMRRDVDLRQELEVKRKGDLRQELDVKRKSDLRRGASSSPRKSSGGFWACYKPSNTSAPPPYQTLGSPYGDHGFNPRISRPPEVASESRDADWWEQGVSSAHHLRYSAQHTWYHYPPSSHVDMDSTGSQWVQETEEGVVLYPTVEPMPESDLRGTLQEKRKAMQTPNRTDENDLRSALDKKREGQGTSSSGDLILDEVANSLEEMINAEESFSKSPPRSLPVKRPFPRRRMRAKDFWTTSWLSTQPDALDPSFDQENIVPATPSRPSDRPNTRSDSNKLLTPYDESNDPTDLGTLDAGRTLLAHVEAFLAEMRMNHERNEVSLRQQNCRDGCRHVNLAAAQSGQIAEGGNEGEENYPDLCSAGVTSAPVRNQSWSSDAPKCEFHEELPFIPSRENENEAHKAPTLPDTCLSATESNYDSVKINPDFSDLSNPNLERVRTVEEDLPENQEEDEEPPRRRPRRRRHRNGSVVSSLSASVSISGSVQSEPEPTDFLSPNEHMELDGGGEKKEKSDQEEDDEEPVRRRKRWRRRDRSVVSSLSASVSISGSVQSEPEPTDFLSPNEHMELDGGGEKKEKSDQEEDDEEPVRRRKRWRLRNRSVGSSLSASVSTSGSLQSELEPKDFRIPNLPEELVKPNNGVAGEEEESRRLHPHNSSAPGSSSNFFAASSPVESREIVHFNGEQGMVKKEHDVGDKDEVATRRDLLESSMDNVTVDSQTSHFRTSCSKRREDQDSRHAVDSLSASISMRASVKSKPQLCDSLAPEGFEESVNINLEEAVLEENHEHQMGNVEPYRHQGHWYHQNHRSPFDMIRGFVSRSHDVEAFWRDPDASAMYSFEPMTPNSNRGYDSYGGSDINQSECDLDSSTHEMSNGLGQDQDFSGITDLCVEVHKDSKTEVSGTNSHTPDHVQNLNHHLISASTSADTCLMQQNSDSTGQTMFTSNMAEDETNTQRHQHTRDTVESSLYDALYEFNRIGTQTPPCDVEKSSPADGTSYSIHMLCSYQNTGVGVKDDDDLMSKSPSSVMSDALVIAQDVDSSAEHDNPSASFDDQAAEGGLCQLKHSASGSSKDDLALSPRRQIAMMIGVEVVPPNESHTNSLAADGQVIVGIQPGRVARTKRQKKIPLHTSPPTTRARRKKLECAHPSESPSVFTHKGQDRKSGGKRRANPSKTETQSTGSKTKNIKRGTSSRTLKSGKKKKK